MTDPGSGGPLALFAPDPTSDPPTPDALSTRLARAFAEEGRRGRRLQLQARTIALVAIALLLAVIVPWPAVLFYHGLLSLFVLIGLVQIRLERIAEKRRWAVAAAIPFVFASLDFALLAVTVLAPNPLEAVPLAGPLRLRVNGSIYMYTLLAGLAFSLRPSLVLWGGVSAAVSWLVMGLWVGLNQGAPTGGYAHRQEALLDPAYLDIEMLLQDCVLFLIVSLILALAVTRLRRLVGRHAALERERGNLARYFSPAVVDQLAVQDRLAREVRETQVAVLFADIVGFTAWSERQAPAAVIERLRAVHARLEAAVFAHGGAVDKFIGDGMMATFGTPAPQPDDAARALACVRTILTEIERWNAERGGHVDEPPVRVAVGLHYGAAVLGDIGSDRRMELAVIGDTVNVASRLESLTRSLGVRAAVSADALDAALKVDPAAGAGLDDGGLQAVRGRSGTVRVHTL